jgi:hypothetical protein
MAYDEHLAGRIKKILDDKHVNYTEKKMMGGLCYMVAEKMCVGIIKDQLMARIDPAAREQLLARNGARPMDFTGKPMSGFLFVEAEGVDMDKDLEFWVQQCLDFNPRAKSSRKK